MRSIVKCLSIGTPKKNPFVLNLKLVIFRCPKLWAHYSLIIMCSNIGTPKAINFPFGTNGKLMVLCVSILKHSRVLHKTFLIIGLYFSITMDIRGGIKKF